MLAHVELVIEGGHIRVIWPEKDRGRGHWPRRAKRLQMSAYDSR